MKARIFSKRIDSWSSKMIVATGQAGKGREIYSIRYWSTGESEQEAMQFCRKFAAQAGVTELYIQGNCSDYDDAIMHMCESCGRFIDSDYYDDHIQECYEGGI